MFYKQKILISNLDNKAVIDRIIKNSKRNGLQAKFAQNEFEVRKELNLNYLFQVQISGVVYDTGPTRKIDIKFKLDSMIRFLIFFLIISNSLLYTTLKISGRELFVVNAVSLDFVIIALAFFMLVLFNFLFWYQCQSVFEKVFKNLV